MHTSNDKKVRCPYNSEHIMPESSLIWHINNKCKSKKKSLQHLFDNCPYNVLHVIRKEFIDEHKIFCPNKPKKDDFKAFLENNKGNDNESDEEDLFAAFKKCADIQFSGFFFLRHKDKNNEKKKMKQTKNELLPIPQTTKKPDAWHSFVVKNEENYSKILSDE